MMFFILGNHPQLSIAELVAVLGPVDYKVVDNKIMLVKNPPEIDPAQLIRRLGGTIKFGKINDSLNNWSEDKCLTIIRDSLAEYEGKLKFGFSVYGPVRLNIKPVAMELKKYLKNKGLSSRWVVSKEATLSSVVVEQNKLIEQGIEVVIIKDGNKFLIGQTLAVQAFKELSARDYGRPASDDYSGMLPPKLAQIMINLSGAKINQVLLDPFCGSGTVLAEALLMGFNQVIGSDNSNKAINDTKANLDWLKMKYPKASGSYELNTLDVIDISKNLSSDSVDVIITEPYLGPQRGRVDVKQTVRDLEKLYNRALAELYKVLKPQGIIVMVWPIIHGQSLRLDIKGYALKRPLSDLSNRSILYSRAGQKVKREIVVLQKK